MSLHVRAAAYFRYTVSARFRLSPAPSSAAEVSFIRDSFAKLATVEHFAFDHAKHNSGKLYEQTCSVCLNPSKQESQLDPFTPIVSDTKFSAFQLSTLQQELHTLLRKLVALPRYSYIANDDLYFSDRSHVPFKHVCKSGIPPDAYDFSTSTISSPFVFLNRGNRKALLPSLRYNFQKFHKFDPLFIRNGIAGILSLTDTPLLTVSVDYARQASLSAGDLLDLTRHPDLDIDRDTMDGFHGFLSSGRKKPDP